MIYRVKLEKGWDAFTFDFDENVVTAGRVDDTALQFMRLASKAFVGAKDDTDGRPFKAVMEVIDDGEKEDF